MSGKAKVKDAEEITIKEEEVVDVTEAAASEDTVKIDEAVEDIALREQLSGIRKSLEEMGSIRREMDNVKKELFIMGRDIKSLQEKTESVKSNTSELMAKAIDIQGKTVTLQDQTTSIKNAIGSSSPSTKEPVKATTTDAAEKQKVDAGSKALLNVITQISEMREDIIKLSNGIRSKIKTMSAEDVLKSFESYQVDMENILGDAGVSIEHFPCETVDTNFQRVVEMVATDDQSKNGAIAERLSEGYRMGDTVIVKEKVSIFRYVEVVETDSKPINETKVTTEEEK